MDHYLNPIALGAQPIGSVNPYAQRVLKDIYHIDAGAARSKGFEEFENVKFDFVITVCDRARETCPVWPGQPIIAHWGAPDPALATGSEDQILEHFRQVAMLIKRRIDLLCALPFDKIDRLRLQQLTTEIGETHQSIEARLRGSEGFSAKESVGVSTPWSLKELDP